jgi:hypothetical protein
MQRGGWEWLRGSQSWVHGASLVLMRVRGGIKVAMGVVESFGAVYIFQYMFVELRVAKYRCV